MVAHDEVCEVKKLTQSHQFYSSSLQGSYQEVPIINEPHRMNCVNNLIYLV